jgi:hypothetical protein
MARIPKLTGIYGTARSLRLSILLDVIIILLRITVKASVPAISPENPEIARAARVSGTAIAATTRNVVVQNQAEAAGNP